MKKEGLEIQQGATKKGYKYVIYVDGKEVWRGKNPRGVFEQIRAKNPTKKVSIAWEPGEEVLIA